MLLGILKFFVEHTVLCFLVANANIYSSIPAFETLTVGAVSFGEADKLIADVILVIQMV